MPFSRRSRPAEPQDEEAPPREATTRAAASLSSLSLTLLRHECALGPGQNVFLSPLSVLVCLAMLEKGACGETRDILRAIIGAPEGVSRILDLMRADNGADLILANALWLDRSSVISPKFTNLCETFFDADALTLDLQNPSSAATINAWVAQKTRGKIPSIVSSRGIAETSAILTNAVWFRGEFATPFREDLTRPQPFFLAGGSPKTVPMMHGVSRTGSYRSGDGFEAAVLPYRGTDIVLYLLLPASGRTPEQVVTVEALAQVLTSGAEYELELSVPRFSLDRDVELKQTLTGSGLRILFDAGRADFSGIGSPPFCIGQVLHRTHLEVYEQGSVAAAATAVLPPPKSGRRTATERKSLVFDRPFGVVIMHAETGAVLFIGVLREPHPHSSASV